MQPLSGLNAVLAVSRSRAMLNQVVGWARRLDQQDYSAMSLQTYRLHYAQAKTVASVLNSMFGGNGGGGQSDKDQLAPGGQGNSASVSSGSTSSMPGSSGGGDCRFVFDGQHRRRRFRAIRQSIWANNGHIWCWRQRLEPVRIVEHLGVL